jgi:hypothetical protein
MPKNDRDEATSTRGRDESHGPAFMDANSLYRACPLQRQASSPYRVVLSYDKPVPIPTQQGLDQWRLQRQRLRRWFWIYLLISAIGAFSFVQSFRSPDPYAFALLLLIPLMGLRQAWRTDRQIVACDRHIRENQPIIKGTDKLEEKSS